MANVKDNGAQNPQGIQRTGGQQPQQPQRGEIMRREAFQDLMRDPFAMMREFMMDPFRMFDRMSPWIRRGGELARWMPDFEVKETDDAFLIKADLPGVRNEDLDITLTGNQLQIVGKRDQEKEEGEGQFHAYERSFGSFTRTFALPEYADLDKIRSDLAEGVLTLVIPKKAGSGPQKKKIQIGSAAKKS